MKNLFFTIIFAHLSLWALAQYSTPGTGVNWDLDDLVANSEGVVTLETNGQFNINESLEISLGDTLSILNPIEINVADEVAIFTVGGTFICDPGASGIVFFKALDNYYYGFDIGDSPGTIFRNTYFKKAGGINVLSSDVLFDGCDFTEFNQENSTGTIGLNNSSPFIQNCSFSDNDGPAIMSGANSNCSPQIFNCEITFNVASNSNTPQINLGTSGTDSIRIINNEIIGNPENDMAGGIALTTLIGGSITARVEGNIIRDNRYGITCYGYDIGTVIRGNEIADNNTQNQPMQGGSGINFYGNETNQCILSGNIITGNLWGITIQGTAQPNFGQLEGNIINPGTNTLMDNGNEGEIYDLYNNTPNTIMAQNNYWGTDDPDIVEMHIFHQVDDPTLGLIEFLPLFDPPVGLEEITEPQNADSFLIYPNPATDHFNLRVNRSLLPEKQSIIVELLNLSGKTIKRFTISGVKDTYRLQLPEEYSGMALVKISSGNFTESRKLYIRK